MRKRKEFVWASDNEVLGTFHPVFGFAKCKKWGKQACNNLPSSEWQMNCFSSGLCVADLFGFFFHHARNVSLSEEFDKICCLRNKPMISPRMTKHFTTWRCGKRTKELCASMIGQKNKWDNSFLHVCMNAWQQHLNNTLLWTNWNFPCFGVWIKNFSCFGV